jgi:hypothetical protein
VEHKAVRIVAAISVGIVIAITIVKLGLFRLDRSLTGAVLTANADPKKQLPIPNVEITAEAGGTIVRTKSDASGFFRMKWRPGVWPGEQVTFRFRHPEHQPLDITRPLNDQLYIARMTSSAAVENLQLHSEEISIGDIRVRYAVKTNSTINIGSSAKIFEVANTGNTPCAGRSPCSPDGKWKAASSSLALDAGEGQEFQNVRVSCIAGPCPFTKIDSDGFSNGGRKIGATIRAWSDTVTFLVEADVVQTMLTDAIRRSYPSIFGRGMSFTLPPTGQGPSIEAEVNGQQIVFPLGPELRLSWATCNIQVASNRTKLYSCELKPGYRFC